MSKNKIPPVHPGEILLEDYLKPMGISQNRLAISMRVPSGRITEIVQGKLGITGETALRLAKAIGTTPGFWMNLQAKYDLRIAEDGLGDALEKEVVPVSDFLRQMSSSD
jgi:addiction module HigA family antidote